MKAKEIGKLGENLAAEYLQKKGFQIIERNFSSRFGEIDLIVKKSGKLIFVEVKTRVGEKLGEPEWAVTRKKIYQVKKMAQAYLVKKQPDYQNLRIDALCIVLDRWGEPKRISHWENMTEEFGI